jgi:hypothetical protein
MIALTRFEIAQAWAKKDLFLANLIFYPECSSDLWSNRHRRPRKQSKILEQSNAWSQKVLRTELDACPFFLSVESNAEG